MKPILLRWLLVAMVMVLAGCTGSMSNDRRWGEDVTLLPGWGKVGEVLWNTVTAPEVWLPAAGALALQIDDGDERVSDWALKHHPVFQDEEEAGDASDNLRAATYVAYGLSVVAAPSGPLDGHWALSKAKALGVGLAAYGLTDSTTDVLKNETNRERPNSEDDRSFPSAHASQTAVYAILADRNFRTTNMPAWAKISSKVGLTALPLATGWARVEAGKHYPGDVLAGVALGNFFGMFINDVFMGIDPEVFQLTVEPGKERGFVGVAIRY
ncbi:MAG: phosphatase PAP2 family protein [Deltaproteobacteria bacterium]|nr:phosphatase PAP2 family protein [Deltaproteobacteria bacterium]